MSNKQISLFGEDTSTSCPPDSRANRSATPGAEKARKMTAISGRRSLERLERFSRATLWERMLLASLIGMKEWYSSRSALTWKLKATKSHRLYYQLVAKTHPTKEIGPGSLPKEQQNKTDTMIPTPTALDAGVGAVIGKNDTFKMNKNGTLRRHIQTGQNMSVNLARQAIIGYLPTPTTSGDESYETRQKRQGHNKAMSYLEANIDYKVNYLPTPNSQEGDKITGTENQDSMTKRVRKATGTTNQLNHHFVAEMMGFPADYTDVAFIDKESDRLEEKIQNIQDFDHQHWKYFPLNHPVVQDRQRKTHPSDKISFAKLRRESIKAYGNAIVPDIAKTIFKAIENDHQRSDK